MVDEFDHYQCEEFLARIDNFYIQLNNNRSATGYFVVSGGDEIIRAKTSCEMMLDGAVAARAYDPVRVTKIRSTNNGKLRVRLWLVPAGAETPDFGVSRWNLALPAGAKPFLFHTDMEQICYTPTFPGQMKEYLDANTGMRVHVVVYANSARSRRKDIRESMPRIKDIPKDRLRYFFVKTKTPYPYSDYWLVPAKKS